MAIKMSRGVRVQGNGPPGFVWVEQKDDNLCWAACIEMLLHGLRHVDKNQYRIHEELRDLPTGYCDGYVCNDPLEPAEIKCALRFFDLAAVEYQDSLSQAKLIEVLAHPVAIWCSNPQTNQGHLLLVVAPVGGDKFFVLDPWPDYASGSLTYKRISEDHPRGKWEWTWFDIQA
jgi:hypothetical protein